MKWEELKNIIIKDISSRALKDPDRRLKSLEKIEIIMQQHYPIYLQNTSNIIYNYWKRIFQKTNIRNKRDRTK